MKMEMAILAKLRYKVKGAWLPLQQSHGAKLGWLELKTFVTRVSRGACGYGNAVGEAPFNSKIAPGGPSLFQSGAGCGTCYGVKCTGNVACLGNPMTLVITDQYPGGPCLAESIHFDWTGTAFGAMAKSDGDGDLDAVEDQEAKGKDSSSAQWLPMQGDSGVLFGNSGSPLNGPLSVKLATPSKRTLVATNVIPAGWVPDWSQLSLTTMMHM
ncbi:LOW QUALITY PROTEIN: RlpA-like protein, double-psi beta-barrel domain [Dillenia turbinata]|uniref:RlpA-like protein, double-psi beta-barrel domain n=1 Tax=Dillenia turbinata TaxID=194707 RepID=A0AAN8Z4F8_9MAGN